MHYIAENQPLNRLNRESGAANALTRISFEARARFFYLPCRRSVCHSRP